MPARSNLFQRLVLQIHRGLGESWDVQESRSLTDTLTGELREVDIVAEGMVHGYRVIMSVEVCDRGRIADVTWVEGLAKKHESLATDKLILWSASGLTAAGARKAAALKIAVVTPTDDAPWATLSKRMRNSIAKLVIANLASVVDVRLPDGTLARWTASGEKILTSWDGRHCCSLERLELLIRTSSMFENVMLDHAPDGQGDFHVVFEPPEPCLVTGPDGVAGLVFRVLTDVKTQAQHSRLAVCSALYNDEVTTLAETEMLGGLFRCVIREPRIGPPSKIALHISKHC